MQFSTRKYRYFSYFATKTCCGYSLKAPRRGASNEYPQHMFLWKNKKSSYLIPTYLKLWIIIKFQTRLSLCLALLSTVRLSAIFSAHWKTYTYYSHPQKKKRESYSRGKPGGNQRLTLIKPYTFASTVDPDKTSAQDLHCLPDCSTD